MATVKMTFSLDEAAATQLRLAAERLSWPKSAVVREAIRDFSERVGRLSEDERQRLLRLFDDLVPRIPTRPLSEVEAELERVRAARRSSGRGSGRARQ